MKIIDLSVTISEEVKEPFPTTITYEDHKAGAQNMGRMIFGGMTGIFPNDNGPAGETVEFNTHAGTHVDAPYHYSPTCGGEPSRTIDEMPLDWFFRPGVVLDFTDKPPGYMFEPADLQEKLADINYTLQPFDIVLIRCDASKHLHEDNFTKLHVGASAAATHWLIDQGIRVVGTDGWSWDIPLHLQVADYKANPRPGVIWEAHFVGIEKEYCQIEKLANLDQLPPFGFTVACFPAKVKAASAGWTRAVAILND